MFETKTLEKLTIRNLEESEMSWLYELAEKEGWNPGINDYMAFYKQDPNGFWVGELDGQKIASISVVKYDRNYGYVGFYIVEENFRHKGYGVQLWNEVLKQYKKMNLSLAAVPNQVSNYSKSGFHASHDNARYRFTAPIVCLECSIVTVDCENVDFSKIADYDESIFGIRRERFLKTWIANSLAYKVVTMSENKITGLGIIRKAAEGWRIGPLFADNSQLANSILYSLSQKVPKRDSFYIDVPEYNKFSDMLYNAIDCFHSVSMYKGTLPHGSQLQKIFGVTSLELG